MFKNSFQLCLFAALVLLCEGCRVHLPVVVNRLDSPETLGMSQDPETKGKMRLRLAGASVGTNEALLSSDTSANFVDTTTASFETARQLEVDAGLSLDDRIEVSAQLERYLTGQVKFQLLGDPRSRAQAGNFSVAATARVGGQKWEETSGVGKAVVNTFLVDGALIAGYRIFSPILLYGGGFATQEWFGGTHTISSTVRDFSGRALQVGGNAGIEAGGSLFFVRAEGAYGNLQSGPIRTGRWHLGVQLGFNFVL